MAYPPQTCTKNSLNSAMATCFSTCQNILSLCLSSSTLWFTYMNPNCHNLNCGVLLGGRGPSRTNALNELTCLFTWLHTLNPHALIVDMSLQTGAPHHLGKLFQTDVPHHLEGQADLPNAPMSSRENESTSCVLTPKFPHLCSCATKSLSFVTREVRHVPPWVCTSPPCTQGASTHAYKTPFAQLIAYSLCSLANSPPSLPKEHTRSVDVTEGFTGRLLKP